MPLYYVLKKASSLYWVEMPTSEAVTLMGSACVAGGARAIPVDISIMAMLSSLRFLLSDERILRGSMVALDALNTSYPFSIGSVSPRLKFFLLTFLLRMLGVEHQD